ncbi:uncharacterized protein LOC131630014 [Vicia villosa]|uniref:uncharacterized protein LOC131630014 n=1 Tax=Vicia villosa TaxID=3911 RepID=UPI00273C0A1B|nr:uncharacterized protein LOC131630014 [Vicia villosa]
MEQIQTEIAEIRAQMGTNISQFREAIQTITHGQEELRQPVQRPDVTVDPSDVHRKGVNLSQEVPLNQNVRNTIQIPVNNAMHLENLSVSSYDTFKFPMDEDEGKFRLLDERLKAIEGRDSLGLDAASLCLVPGIKIPLKFKVPNFEKYKGITCPMTHIKAFCNKMAPYAENDKLLIHLFQESLSGASLEWYTQLERTNIRTWKDLAKAFFKHYKHNSDMAPTIIQLQDMFMGTLRDPYLNRMVGCVASEFSALVVTGERIEHGLKTGKIQDVATTFEFQEQDDEETSTISEVEEEDHAYSPVQIPCYQMAEVTPNQDAPQICAATISQPPIQFVQQKPYQSIKYAPLQQNYQHNHRQQGRQRYRKPKRVFDMIPMPYSQLLSQLLELSLVETKQLDPVIPPYPVKFDPNIRCGYHAGAPGHSIEDCKPFRDKVQDLLDSKAIVFTPNGQN